MREATDDRVTLVVNGIDLRFAPKGRWVELIQRAKMAQVTNDGLRVPDGAFQAAAQQAAAIFAQRRRQAAKKSAGDAQLFPV